MERIKDLQFKINRYKKDPKNEVAQRNAINALFNSEVFIPLYSSKPIIPYVISVPGHEHLVAVFIDANYIPKEWQNKQMLKLPFKAAVDFATQNPNKEFEIILDPGTNDLVLNKKAIGLS